MFCHLINVRNCNSFRSHTGQLIAILAKKKKIITKSTTLCFITEAGKASNKPFFSRTVDFFESVYSFCWLHNSRLSHILDIEHLQAQVGNWLLKKIIKETENYIK